MSGVDMPDAELATVCFVISKLPAKQRGTEKQLRHPAFP
jgi:hypothetical protein